MWLRPCLIDPSNPFSPFASISITYWYTYHRRQDCEWGFPLSGLYIPPTSSRADRLIHPLKRIPDRSEIKIRAMWHHRRRLLINHRRLSWMQFSSLLDYMGGRPGHALHRNDRHLEISSPRRRIFYILATSQIAIASLTRIFAKGVPRAKN